MAEFLILNWGGGVNSTAVAAGYAERGIRPDLIIWSDTGGEKPGTYEYVEAFAAWVKAQGWPELVRVAYQGKHDRYTDLEGDCHANKRMPSVAYGFKSCSIKYKREPIVKFEKAHPPLVAFKEAGGKPTKVLGFDAGEERRAGRTEDDDYLYAYPLIEWDWDRNDCLLAIQRVGLPIPPKSACFFCPNSKKREVLALAKNHPDLFERAIAIERLGVAGLQEDTALKGLGRYFNWEQLVKDFGDKLAQFNFSETEMPYAAREKYVIEQLTMFDRQQEDPCDCYDDSEAA